MSVILITGGAGFIGAHLTKLFLQSGRKVVIVDNFSYGKKANLPVDHSNLSVYTLNILDKPALENIIRDVKPSLVYHLAAIHHIPTCELEPGIALRTNIEGTCSLLDACKSTSVEKIIFASSGAVYEIRDEALNEDLTPVVPHDIYSISKAGGEDLLRLYSERGYFQGISCRLFNAVGPGETNAHLVPEILEQIKSGNNDIRLGNVSTHRGYIHVRDVAEALFRLGDKKINEKYQVFNIGRETEHTALDLVQIISEISGKKFNIIKSQEKIRPNDRPYQRASMEKLKRVLDWTPGRTVKEALTEAYQEVFANE